MDIKLKRQTRRIKANNRERQRMHDLNHALDILRKHVPLNAQQIHPHQKLSKIETLRLARNYINALNWLLQNTDTSIGKSTCNNIVGNAFNETSLFRFAEILSEDMSQATSNLIAGALNVDPHTLNCIRRQRRCINTNSSCQSGINTTNSSPSPSFANAYRGMDRTSGRRISPWKLEQNISLSQNQKMFYFLKVNKQDQKYCCSSDK